MTPRRRHAIGRIATTAAILSAWTIVLGAAVAWLNYRGAAGEPYSPLNHWISELGQIGVSGLATVFNLALVVAGVEFVIFMVGLAQTSPSRLRWVFGPLGAVAGIGAVFVGIYPMNHPDEHLFAATTYFTLAWIAVGLASISFLRFPDPRFPGWLAVGGGLPVAASIAFLVVLRLDAFTSARMAATGPIQGRPDVWLGPILEWAVLVAITGWTLLAGMTWRTTLKPRQPAEGAR